MNGLIAALRSYQQADEEGIMCIVSRQAVEEAADEIERLRAALDECAQWMSTREKQIPGLERLCDRARDVLASTK